ncbi:flavin reductase family protein [Variovorax sp. ZT4R33]|uniref:flavin reductase family protein n=1 Tax=Variovorax sp. ZT4R33 TaxID=3443743 RepID=UPI003F47165C
MDSKEFRNALGHFATGVAIVTASVDGIRIGATISSFNSVSLDPPLVLFSMIRGSLGIAQWKAAKSYCIAVLGESQRDLSNRFAKAGSDKWIGIDPSFAGNGAPLVPGAIAYFQCEPWNVCDGGDHEIFICRVTAFEVSLQPEPSLIFCGGRYRHLSPLDAVAKPPPENLYLHGW